MKHLAHAVMLVTLVCTLSACTSTPFSAPKVEAIDDAMRGCIQKNEIAGAVTLVADDRKILHLSAVGEADAEAHKPMQTDAIMWIASMTKPVTTTAVLMLQEEGRLKLDDRVSKYIPEFAALRTPSGKPAEITIRQCLTHTSGLAEATGEEFAEARTLKDLIPAYLSRSTYFEPGSKWQYCQSGINTAARIVEIVSGYTFPGFLEQRLFRPLGMTDTTFYLSPEQMPRLAKSYKLVGGKLEPAEIGYLHGKSPTDRLRVAAGNGGLFSTARDYAKFCQMLLNDGTLDEKQYLKPESVKLMKTIQTGDLQTGFTPGNGWGIGCCVVRQPQGITAMLSPGSFGHGGAYGTQAWIDPVKSRIYILFVQRANFPNSDASPVRLAFQEAAAKSLN